MISLVPYGDSDDEEQALSLKEEEEPRKKKRLNAFNSQQEVTSKRDNVHTSLGIAASKPIKGDWLCYAFVSGEYRVRLYIDL